MKTIVGLVAVRSGSSRLPRKAFAELAGRPLIEVLIDRLIETKRLDAFVICTTRAPEDDAIVELCERRGVRWHRGETGNMLARFLGAVEHMPSEYVVRITGDNPLSDFETMHDTFQVMRRDGTDYGRPVGVPLGSACEVIRTATLQQLLDETETPDLSEYMTWFLEQAPFVRKTLFEVGPEIRMPELRVTIDYEEDLVFLNRMFSHFGRVPTLAEAVAYSREHGGTPPPRPLRPEDAAIRAAIRFKDQKE